MQEQDACGQSMVQKFIDGKCSADELNIIREMDPETFGKCLEALKLVGSGATSNNERHEKLEIGI